MFFDGFWCPTSRLDGAGITVVWHIFTSSGTPFVAPRREAMEMVVRWWWLENLEMYHLKCRLFFFNMFIINMKFQMFYCIWKLRIKTIVQTCIILLYVFSYTVSSLIYSNPVHPQKLTWHRKSSFWIGTTSSNCGCSIAMLVFGGGVGWLAMTWNLRKVSTSISHFCSPGAPKWLDQGVCSGDYMDVSENGGTQPRFLLLKMIILGCFGGTTI